MLENLPDSSNIEPKFLPKSFFNNGNFFDDQQEHSFVDDIEYHTLSNLFKSEEEDDLEEEFKIEVSQAMRSPYPPSSPSEKSASSQATVDLLPLPLPPTLNRPTATEPVGSSGPASTSVAGENSRDQLPTKRVIAPSALLAPKMEPPSPSPPRTRRGRPPKNPTPPRPPLKEPTDYLPIAPSLEQHPPRRDPAYSAGMPSSLTGTSGISQYPLPVPPTSGSSAMIPAGTPTSKLGNTQGRPATAFDQVWRQSPSMQQLQSPLPQTPKPYPALSPVKRSLSTGSLTGGSDTNEDEVERKERRRERNRLLARKTRMRKKFFFESLQRKAAILREENSKLKRVVKEKLPDEASQILSGCHTSLPQVVVDCTEQANTLLVKPDHTMMGLLQDLKPSFCVTDPKLPDNPIVFASEGFMKLTGYTRDQVIGRNCRFLQGPRTDQNAVEKLRSKIKEGSDVSVLFLNYRADRTPFWNNVFIAALRDPQGNIVNYVGVQHPVDGKGIPELK
mmetsp:Transcript_36096/g.47600  ORF Transcript_36096/g.47600 Transcript_36096/m.47600 type:complete len:503 (+) Transcript_36096:105-1613(+)